MSRYAHDQLKQRAQSLIARARGLQNRDTAGAKSLLIQAADIYDRLAASAGSRDMAVTYRTRAENLRDEAEGQISV